MLSSIEKLSTYTIEATDGGIGQVNSFLFDDQGWIIRYVVVDTRAWLPGRKVLIPPSELGTLEAMATVLPVELTRDQVKNSPDIDTDQPVSRQQELKLFQHYNWAPYWGESLGPMVTPYAAMVPSLSQELERSSTAVADEDKDENDPHLRSTAEVINYKIHATDGHIGHVEDFIVDDEDWKIRYIVIDTRNWLPGRKVIIPPDWITDIDWHASQVHVNVTREVIKDSPKYDPSAPVNREYEIQFYDYYRRPKYWL